MSNPTRRAIQDEHLVSLARNGDKQAFTVILRRYEPLVQQKASQYYVVGGDRCDLLQEGRWGVACAVKDFDASRNVPFREFARLCATRQMLTAVRASTRQRQAPLRGYVDVVDAARGYGPREHWFDGALVAPRTSEPEVRLIAAEEATRFVQDLADQLTKLEGKVFTLQLAGCSRTEIGNAVGGKRKTTDNAIQRVRRKAAELGEARALQA